MTTQRSEGGVGEIFRARYGMVSGMVSTIQSCWRRFIAREIRFILGDHSFVYGMVWYGRLVPYHHTIPVATASEVVVCYGDMDSTGTTNAMVRYHHSTILADQHPFLCTQKHDRQQRDSLFQ